MKLKNFVLFSLLAFGVIAGGIIFFGKMYPDSNESADSAAIKTPSTSSAVEQPDNAPISEETAQTATQTVPAPAACGSGGSCTPAEVAVHNTQTDCWVIYEGKVYDVTAYTRAHPGGANAFDTSTCGTDIAAQLSGQASSDSLRKKKRHSSKDLQILSTYYIADLAQ